MHHSHASRLTIRHPDEAKATADSSRLIPPYNADAQSAKDVYALHDIIPEAEFNALPISAFKSAKSDRDRIALLPFNRSDWLKLQLKLIYSAPKANKTDLYVYTSRYPLLRSSRNFPGKLSIIFRQ